MRVYVLGQVDTDSMRAEKERPVKHKPELRDALIDVMTCKAVAIGPEWQQESHSRLLIEVATALGVPVINRHTQL